MTTFSLEQSFLRAIDGVMRRAVVVELFDGGHSARLKLDDGSYFVANRMEMNAGNWRPA